MPALVDHWDTLIVIDQHSAGEESEQAEMVSDVGHLGKWTIILS